nr:hypothetical protein GCM10020093_004110 [Planobispora longispora]
MRVLSRALAAFAAVGVTAAGVAVLTSTPALAAPGTVVVSQVYGGGGNSGAPFANDFVELFNRSSAPVALDGWSVQYASATGTGNFAAGTVALSGTLAPGQYHLVQLAGGANGAALPTPDSTGSVNMSGSSGKVALVRSAEGLACNGGSAPCTPEQTALIADLVGYGTANYSEGAAAPPCRTPPRDCARPAAAPTPTPTAPTSRPPPRPRATGPPPRRPAAPVPSRPRRPRPARRRPPPRARPRRPTRSPRCRAAATSARWPVRPSASRAW